MMQTVTASPIEEHQPPDKRGDELLMVETDQAETSPGNLEIAPSTEVTLFPVPWKHPIKFVALVISRLFAFASLMLVLAVLAAIPIVNFFVLGYFLNVEGRVARSGKIRDGFPLLDIAPRFVTIAAGIWIFLLPLRFLSSFAADARLIDPGAAADVNFHIGLSIAWVLITTHLIFALARGGSFWCFVRPFKNIRWTLKQLREGNYFAHADQKIQEFVQRMEIRKHYSLGFRGFAVALLWLFIPTVLFSIAEEPEGFQILLTVVGGFLLAITLSWAPFLQARFAAEGNFSAGMQLREVRSLYAHSPIVWSLSLVALYVLALPLYLFKAFLLPADAMWVITLIFVVTIYPTRILLGWVYHRAVQKREAEKKAHWTVRWLFGALIIVLLNIFVFILFFTQFLGEEGKLVLFHHHSLLLPAPFQGTINP